MEHVEKLFKTTVDEISRLLDSKTVVGEAMQFNGKTVIPLLSVGFGFGAGGGSGKSDKQLGEGMGGGTGGGGGIMPVAIVVIDGDDVRLETMKPWRGGVIERVTEAIAKTTGKSKSKDDDSGSKKKGSSKD